MYNNIITVSGDPGSGKTSTIKVLKRTFEQEEKKVIVYSTGAIFRELAEKKGMTVTEFNQFLEEQKCDTDAEVDNAVQRLGKKIIEQKDESLIHIIDSRLAWHNIPESFKVRLTVSDEIAGKRIFFDKTRGEEDRYNTLEEAINETRERKQSERDRYMKRYKVNILESSNFDMNINTSLVTPEEVAQCIIGGLKQRRRKKNVPNRWANPKCFLPTQSIRDMSETKTDKFIEDMKNIGNDDSSQPIYAVQVDNINFVIDGHHRCISASKSNIPLIPYKILGKDDETYPYNSYQTVRDFISRYIEYYYPGVLYDFEEAFGNDFRYTEIYPEIYSIKTKIVKNGEHR